MKKRDLVLINPFDRKYDQMDNEYILSVEFFLLLTIFSKEKS